MSGVLLTLTLLADGDRIRSWIVGRVAAPARARLRQAAAHAYARLSGLGPRTS